jgi:hypothetical protein
MINKNSYKKYLEMRGKLSSLKNRDIELEKQKNILNLEIRDLENELKEDFEGFEELGNIKAKNLKEAIISDKIVDISFELGGHLGSDWEDFVRKSDFSKVQNKYLKKIGDVVKKHEMDIEYLVSYSESIGLEIESGSSKLIERLFDKIIKEIPHKMLSSDDVSELKEIIYNFVKYLKE